ncbi:MAG: hypothetical protein Q7J65_09545 [Candidatus Marinimicrobia bacterium]|nr:hypothetical protein [Candidatus Neomarinimicrobiota bacterium]
MKTYFLWIVLICGLVTLNGEVLPVDALNTSLFPEDISEANLEIYLEVYLNNPLDWNRCNRADIEALPLNEYLLDRLTSLKNQHPKIDNWKEFQSITKLDKQELKVVQLFIILEQKQLERDIQFMNYTSVNKKNTVDLNKSLSRGKIEFGRRLSIGFIAESDQGERMLWDYRNVSVTMRSLSGQCVLGLSSFKMDWGHGLLFARSNLAFKSMSVAGNVLAGTPRFSAYVGSDENRYLQGVYLSQQWKHLSLYSAVSSHRLDATIQDSTVQSFRETGIHSTDSEIAAKDTLRENTLCGGLLYSDSRFLGGILVFQSHYSFPVSDYFNQSRQSGISIYQKVDLGDWRFSGEVAALNSKEYAVIQGFVFQSNQYTLGVQYRYFSDYFSTRLSSAMKEYSGSNGNEKGIYLGLQCKINQRNRAGGYIDFYSKNRSFEKGVEPFHGSEAVVYLDHRRPAKHFINLRLKRELSGANIAKYQTTVSARYYFLKSISMSFRGIVNEIDHRRGTGTSVSLSVSDIKTMELTVGTTQFYSPVYNTRIYLYEPGIPLRFNMVSLYGAGSRYFIIIQNRFRNDVTTALSLKTQARRLITESDFCKTFLVEFQMVVDL